MTTQVLRSTVSACGLHAHPKTAPKPPVSSGSGVPTAPTPDGGAVIVLRSTWHLAADSERSEPARGGKRSDVVTERLDASSGTPSASVPSSGCDAQRIDHGKEAPSALPGVGGKSVDERTVNGKWGFEFGRKGDDEMARKASCFAKAEETLIDIQVAEAQYLKDGRLDDREKLALFPLLQKLRGHNEYMVPTGLFIQTAVTGEQGIFSDWVDRCWKESRKQRRDNVIPFPEMGGGEAA